MSRHSRYPNFMKRHVYIGTVKVGRNEVPRWRYDWKVTVRSKYKR